MSSRIPTTFLFPTSKRSACDRCRHQKLRCPPRENWTQPCMRCIRAGVQCTTGYSKPLGRAVRDMATIYPPFDAQTVAVSSVEMSRAAPNGGRPAPTASSIQRSPSTTTAEPTSLEIEDTLNLSGSYMHASSLVSDVPYFSNAAFNLVDHMDERMGPLSDDLENLPLPHPPSELAAAGHMETSVKEQRSHHPNGDAVESARPGAECDLRLSRLDLDLCQQMQLCIAGSEPWSAATAEACTPENPLECMEKGFPTDGTFNSNNNFGDALRSTSEFLAIIQSYSWGRVTSTSSPAGPDNGHQSESNNSASRFSLRQASILNLLSSYLRLVAIYDFLFLRLYELLSCGGSSSSSSSSGLHGPVPGLQTLPGLQLAGFSVQQGSLQTKILIEAIQHQFGMIEKALGLPAEFRLLSHGQNVCRTGLLDCQYARTLVHAVMSDGHGGGKGAPAPMGSLESLRRNIMEVRQIVDMST